MTGGEDLSPAGAGRLVWTGARTFVPLPSKACGIDVADSWLVDGGRCRGLELHRQRFAGSCRRHDVAPGVVDAFLEDVIDVLPRAGRWFPRVEYHAGEFRFWLRPAPRLSASVVLWVPGVGDPRTEPSVKGPDLAALEVLRDEAGRVGAGEALLLSPQGEVREGALSGLMWWRGDGLCAPPDGPYVLPSVTRRLILRLAAQRGQAVRFESCRLADLDGLEVWSISALHGIRSVSGWQGAALVPGEGRHAVDWQRQLLSLAVPLPEPRVAPTAS